MLNKGSERVKDRIEDKVLELENLKKKKRTVWLVGAGPSDPSLITLKGRFALENADVIVYDSLVGKGVMALANPESKFINVGKIAGNHPVPQDEINEILVREAEKNQFVVRIKGGDPFVFGRGGEEIERLIEAKIPYEVVPGVTSAVSVPSYNGIPVTHRDFTSSFHVITGHTKEKDEAEIDYEALVRLNGTLIFLMGIGAMERICKNLIKAGMDSNVPAAVLEKGTTAKQRKVISTVENLYEDAMKNKIKTPAIIVVGKVCQLGENFEWASKRPLGKLKIAVTKPIGKSSKLGKNLRILGADVVEMPSIQVKEIENNDQLASAVEKIDEFKWLAFTSPVGVKVFFKTLVELNKDIRSLGNLKIAVVGTSTENALREFGIIADLKPEVFTGEGLGKKMVETLNIGDKVLIPRAELGGEDLVNRLSEKGIVYEDIPVYETLYKGENPALKYSEDMDLVAFTSASTVRAFVSNNRGLDMTKINAVCIGTETGKEASKHNMNVFISPKSTIDHMTAFIVESFGEKREY